MANERRVALTPAHAAAITPSDTVNLPNAAYAIYVGGAGNITLDTVGGETSVVFTALPVGTILTLAVKRVRATGTTATLLVAIY